MLQDTAAADRFARRLVHDFVAHNEAALDAGFRAGRPLDGAGELLRQGLSHYARSVSPSLGPPAVAFGRALAAALGEWAQRHGYATAGLEQLAAVALGAPPIAAAPAPPPPDPRPRRDVRVAPAPRRVSLGARLRAVLGHEVSLIVLGILVATTFFFWAFAANSEAATAIELRGDLGEVEGEVTRVSSTFSSENKTKIWQVDFEYEVAGKTHRQSSYRVGPPKLRPGDELRVEYAKARPDRARAVGMRGRMFAESVVVVAIFPAICLLVWIGTVFVGLGRLRMLRRGRLAWGRLVERELLRGQPSQAPHGQSLTFEYDDPDDGSLRLRTSQRRRRASVQVTIGADGALTDEPEEPLLCPPRGSRGPVMMIDAMPSGIRFDERGEVVGGLGWTLLPYLAALVDFAAIAAFVADLLGP